MLHHRVSLHYHIILDTDDNQDNEILHICQWYWITEAIHYTHHAAVEKLFNNHTDWSAFLIVECLSSHHTSHYALDSILENEDTISDTYNVIDAVFKKQLKYDCEKNFND